uniref:hypothetical protein n=1 Tax=Rahnella sp. ChDrAdgB13 TaxID=1850581 RepID=UPI001AD89548
MNKQTFQDYTRGNLNITLLNNEGLHPISISLPNCSLSDFVYTTKQAYEFKDSTFVHVDGWTSEISSKEQASELSSKSEGISFNQEKAEDKMTDFNRNELNAHLKANKAEVDSVASAMRTEMANFRTYYVESFAEQSKALNRIESRADATEKRLTQAQWIVSLVISICAVTLSAVIFFSNKSANKPVQQQPSVVVNTAQPSNIPPPLNQK